MMALPTSLAALTVGAFHWKMSGAEVNFSWHHLLHILASKQTPEEAAQKERIQRNAAMMRVSNYILFSQIFVHLVAWKTMWLAFGVWQNPHMASCILLLLHLGLYVQHLLVVKGYIQPTTPLNVHVLSALVYVTYALGYFVTSFVDGKDSFPTGSTTLSEKYVLATRFFLVMAFIDTKLSVVCQLLFSMTILGTSWYHGKELGYLHVTDECEIYVCLIVFMMIIEVMMRKRVQACLQSADAEWMVSSFRRVLRGVCDCEFLLDHQLKIQGNPECLQHMLMSDKKLQGMEFTQLLADQEVFKKSVEMSTRTAKRMKSPADVQAASCMRVSFATKTSQRSADLFHVPVPQPLGEPYHLLAVREDSESPILEALPLADENDGTNSWDRSTAMGTKCGSSESSMSTVWDQTPVQEILELEMMLLVDVDSEGFDVEQLQISFKSSTSNDRNDTSKAPKLRHMMKAKEWRRVAKCFTAFAKEQGEMEAKGPEKMKPFRLHLPWSGDEAFMTARDVELSHFRSFRSDGTTKLCLHLKDFFK